LFSAELSRTPIWDVIDPRRAQYDGANRDLVRWLQRNQPPRKNLVFVHG
jgi:hypothetical protein